MLAYVEVAAGCFWPSDAVRVRSRGARRSTDNRASRGANACAETDDPAGQCFACCRGVAGSSGRIAVGQTGRFTLGRRGGVRRAVAQRGCWRCAGGGGQPEGRVS
jgi:hypothetical protein